MDAPRNPLHRPRWAAARQQWAARQPGHREHAIPTISKGRVETLTIFKGIAHRSVAPMTLPRLRFLDGAE